MQLHNRYRPLYLLISLAVLVNLSGLFVPLIDPDAGVYASISKTMVQQNDFVNLWFQETDWLDKPHFPFWITAAFFKVFGFHDWAYKLPGILFVFMGAWYTYLFAQKYYNKTIALWSAFILLTSMHIIISNNDVRAEPYLTGLIIASVYHFTNALKKAISWQLIIACFFAGLAVMTKGIFTLIPIAGAIAGHLIVTKDWKQLLHYRWIVATILLVLFISPELYCLWKQFDQHPEKKVLGNTNVSGIQFFLWDSQFGRFFNTGPIKGKGDKLFFLHTLLWAFLPWAILMYAALFDRFRNAKTQANFAKEWFTVCAAVVTILVFSFSSFQLPHYTNIIFPFLSIITASFIYKMIAGQKRVFASIQNVVTILLLLLVAGLSILYKTPFNFIVVASMILVPATYFLIASSFAPGEKPYLRSGLAIIFIGLFLNLSFYPSLLQYQSGNKAAAYLNKEYANEPVGRIGIYFPSGEFYLNQPTFRTDSLAIKTGQFNKARILFITEEEKNQLQRNNISFTILREFDEFHISMLTLKFVNAKTRHKELKKQYLVRLN